MHLINFIRPIIISLGCLLVLLAVFIFSYFSEQYQENYALDAFLKQDYAQAKQKLASVKDSLPQSRYLVIQSAISREQDRLKQSTQQLTQAQLKLGNSDTQLNSEILISLAINQYLAETESSFLKTMKQIKQQKVDFSHLELLLGLEAFLQQDYSKAISYWEQFDFTKEPSYPWLAPTLKKLFSKDKLALNLIEAKIKKEDWVEARADIEVFLKSSPSTASSSQAYYLMGLSYLLEARQKPVEAAGPFLELAKNYLENLPIHNNENLSRKEFVVDFLGDFFEHHLYQTPHPNLEELTYVIRFLESWKAKDKLDQLASNLLSAFHKDRFQADEEELLVSQSANLAKNHPLFMSALSKYLVSDIAQSLDNDRFDLTQTYWKLVKQLELDNDSFQMQLAPLFTENLLKQLQNDSSFTQALDRVSFFKTHFSHAQLRLKLAQQLIKVSGNHWLNKNQEKKALKIMIAADDLLESSLKHLIKQDVQLLLGLVYQQALKDSNQDKILFVQSAVKYFNIHLAQLKASA